MRLQVHEPKVARELGRRYHHVLSEAMMEPHFVTFSGDSAGARVSDPVEQTICVMAMDANDATSKARMVAERMSRTNIKIIDVTTRQRQPERDVPVTTDHNNMVSTQTQVSEQTRGRVRDRTFQRRVSEKRPSVFPVARSNDNYERRISRRLKESADGKKRQEGQWRW